MRLFFATWSQRLDCDSPEWLKQEVFADPPDGPRRIMDLVAKVHARQPIACQPPVEGEQWLALVHIEIESPDKASPMRPRMYQYHRDLRGAYRLPVLPIAVFLRVGLDGVGVDMYVESFEEFEVVRFQYLYVGLPGLDGLQYLQGENWLGVALSALMRIPKDRVAWLGAEALRRLTEAPINDRQRFLLVECVQAYLSMDEVQQREYDALLAAEPYAGVKAVNKTVYEQGIEKGIELGHVRARRQLLREQLEDKFGPLPPAAINRLESMPPEQLARLTRAVLHAATLKEIGLADD